MPFTPFHFGPALGLGLPTRKYIHAPTFIIANVIVDVEPFVVLFLGLRYPLHGYLHTFLLASLTGLIFGYVMFSVERFFHPLFKLLFLETGDTMNLTSFMLAGALGTILHVLLDSPLYTDIQPFYPITANLLYNPALSSKIYNLCVWLGIIGIAHYASLLILSTYKKLMKKVLPKKIVSCTQILTQFPHFLEMTKKRYLQSTKFKTCFIQKTSLVS